MTKPTPAPKPVVRALPVVESDEDEEEVVQPKRRLQKRRAVMAVDSDEDEQLDLAKSTSKKSNQKEDSIDDFFGSDDE